MGILKVSVRQEAWFDQGLETITDTNDETAFGDKGINGCPYFFIKQDIDDKFGRAIWFISRWEAPRKEDDLGLFDMGNHVLHRLGDGCFIEGHKWQQLDLGTCLFKGLGRIVLGVGSRENRNVDQGLLHSFLGLDDRIRCHCWHLLQICRLFKEGWINFFQFPFIGRKELGSCKDLAIHCQLKVSYGLTKLDGFWNLISWGEDKATQLTSQAASHLIQLDAGPNPISEAHQGQAFQQASIFDSWGSCDGILGLNSLETCKVGFYQVKIDMFWNGLAWQIVDRVASGLKFWREYFVHIRCCHPKGYQSWRNRQFLKGSRHGILTSDGRQTQLNLGFNRAQQGCHRLTKALCLLVHPLEVFLIREAGLGPATSRRNQAGSCFNDRIGRPVIRRPFSDIRVEALGHYRCRLGHTILNW